jgi:hypothetical protein
MVAVLRALTSVGWPYTEVAALSVEQKRRSTGTVVAIYLSLVGFSCVFHVLILRHREAANGLCFLGVVEQRQVFLLPLGAKFDLREEVDHQGKSLKVDAYGYRPMFFKKIPSRYMVCS